jgi:hypothetical protein
MAAVFFAAAYVFYFYFYFICDKVKVISAAKNAIVSS